MGQPGHLAGSSNAEGSQEAANLHIPVLLQPTLTLLRVRPGATVVDGTVGAGGHAAAILAATSPDGRLLGLDRDPAALAVARQRLASFGERVTLRHGSFARLAELAGDFAPLDGLLLDLGLSSLQLADAGRGFAFARPGPLDMRFDPQAGGPTAADLVNELTVQQLTDLLYRFGEEKQARRIAAAIVAARPLRSTEDLAQAVVAAVGRGKGRIHPATRTFQALRIAVNDELAALEEALPQALDLLAPGGRLVVIAFHSLEDRMVKQFLRREARDCLCPPDAPVCICGHRARVRLLTPHPIRPDAVEVQANPRARSARLRAAERIASGEV